MNQTQKTPWQQVAFVCLAAALSVAGTSWVSDRARAQRTQDTVTILDSRLARLQNGTDIVSSKVSEISGQLGAINTEVEKLKQTSARQERDLEQLETNVNLVTRDVAVIKSRAL